jgi:hypothetical protein
MNNLELLKVHHFDKKIRLGVNTDGGYVMGELGGEKYDCYISCGISNEESFSRDFINKYDMNKENCFGFDGTINDYPYEYTNKISFIRKNIGSVDNDKLCNLSSLMSQYNNIFLKMDIEGGEYDWLKSVSESQLKKFKQIVIEFHGLTNNGWGCHYNEKIECLTKLNNTHYIIHAHGNNNGPVVNGIPDVLELTYVNKDYFNGVVPELNKVSLPIPGLDFTNNQGRADINLNREPFRFIRG